jgi:hypothetical protein
VILNFLIITKLYITNFAIDVHIDENFNLELLKISSLYNSKSCCFDKITELYKIRGKNANIIYFKVTGERIIQIDNYYVCLTPRTPSLGNRRNMGNMSLLIDEDSVGTFTSRHSRALDMVNFD